jgi:predicted 3-demethylubiquinone-9 3-methyltransferase (glyoxalase superfamily)
MEIDRDETSKELNLSLVRSRCRGGCEVLRRDLSGFFGGVMHRAPSDNPSSKEGDVLTVEFTVMGIPCIGLNGGPGVEHNWRSRSKLQQTTKPKRIATGTPSLTGGGEESQCGWCKDRWGVHWQITPTILTKAFTGSDRAAAKRAFDAMMAMKNRPTKPNGAGLKPYQ